MPRTPAQNRATVKYVNSHREQHRLTTNKGGIKYYAANREVKKAYRNNRYHFQMEIKRLFNMFDAL
jgi:hypothetical protein